MNETTIRLRVEELPDGTLLATNASVPGLVAEGRNVAGVTETAQGLARKIAETCIEHGDPLPPALADPVEPEAGIDLRVPVSVPWMGGVAGFWYQEVARRRRRRGRTGKSRGPRITAPATAAASIRYPLAMRGRRSVRPP